MTMKRVVPRDEAHRDVESAIDHYAHEAGPDVALGFVSAEGASRDYFTHTAHAARDVAEAKAGILVA